MDIIVGFASRLLVDDYCTTQVQLCSLPWTLGVHRSQQQRFGFESHQSPLLVGRVRFPGVTREL